MSEARRPLHLFDAYGVEIEYMIVDRDTLAVRQIADQLLHAVAGAWVSDWEEGPVAWSNELALHVIELKMREPAARLAGWADLFQAEIRRIDEILAPLGACLLPGGMHPTMDPVRETRLWPHENAEIYATYDRIFGCRQHGWANLQSVHLNLPFQGDEEFGALHAAVRAVLPLVPALAASSPMMEGRSTGRLDSRLWVYATHQARIPAAMGRVIPEPVYTEAEYDEHIFAPLRAEIAPLDGEGVLEHEFLNARGAIARFARGSIELRLLDSQETPAADLAIVLLVTAALRALVQQRWVPLAELQALETEALASVLDRTMVDADEAVVELEPLCRVFGCRPGVAAGELWVRLREELAGDGDWSELAPLLDELLAARPLARRIQTALGQSPSAARVQEVWRELARCLVEGRLFTAATAAPG